ncbi:MAG: sigma 54-interacting transcriptional regulator [Desulfitobacteriia bacterium]|jgi:arginine utilization regulatory protein
MNEIDNSLFQLIVENTKEGIIVTDSEESILYFNHAAQSILDMRIEKNTNLFGILPLDLANRSEKGQKEMKLRDKTISVRVKDCSSVEHKVRLYYVSDISEKVQQEDRLLCLNTILDSINEGVLASNIEGEVFIFNSQIERFEGRSREKILGKHITDVYDVTSDTSEQLRVLKTGKPLIDVNLNYVTNGKEINVVSSTYPIIKNGQLIAVVSVSRNVTEIRRLLAKTVELQGKMFHGNKNVLTNGTKYTFADIIGESPAIKAVINKAKKAAYSMSPVLIYGETGTGKELFAQSIHNAGPEKDQPFVAVNCAAIPETLLESLLYGTVKGAFTGAEGCKGLFEQANKGTLFLDEINSMSVSLQAKILRALQEKMIRRVGAVAEVPIQCRIISSTNVDPWQCVIKGSLRKDLYYRLMVINLNIPPLRKRRDDIDLLVKYFLQKYARLYGKTQIRLSDEYLKALKKHAWPGNVRELEHALESSVAMLEDEDELCIQHLPAQIRNRFGQENNYKYISLADTTESLQDILKKVEEKVIINALQNCNGNVSRAANDIGISRQNLQYRIRKLQIGKMNGDITDS